MEARLVILGAPGAGKGTQARRLKKKFGWAHISTGDMFRAHLENQTPLGKKIESYMDSGQLVPDELTCEIVAERLQEPDCAKGYILDGFPRSVPQAEALDQILAGREESLDAVLLLDVPDDEIVARLAARRTCPQCGKIYNLTLFPPKNDNVCDKDNTTLERRPDDEEDKIRTRLAVYHETTEPLINYYSDTGLLRRIPATEHDLSVIEDKIEEVLMARDATES